MNTIVFLNRNNNKRSKDAKRLKLSLLFDINHVRK